MTRSGPFPDVREIGDTAILKLVFLVVCLLNAAAASAQTTEKFNPYSGRWEAALPDAQLRYHPESGQWNYTGPNATPRYDARENRWDLAPPNYRPPLNPDNNRPETASPNSRLQFDPQVNPRQTDRLGISPPASPQSPRLGSQR